MSLLGSFLVFSKVTQDGLQSMKSDNKTDSIKTTLDQNEEEDDTLE